MKCKAKKAQIYSIENMNIDDKKDENYYYTSNYSSDTGVGGVKINHQSEGLKFHV